MHPIKADLADYNPITVAMSHFVRLPPTTMLVFYQFYRPAVVVVCEADLIRLCCVLKLCREDVLIVPGRLIIHTHTHTHTVQRPVNATKGLSNGPTVTLSPHNILLANKILICMDTES